MRPWLVALVAMTFAIPALPALAEEATTIPLPRVGDRLDVEQRWTSWGSTSVVSISFTWTGGPVEVEDAFDVVHVAYPVVYDARRDWTSHPITAMLDLGTREVVREDSDHVWDDSDTLPEGAGGPHRTARTVSSLYGEGYYAYRATDALQGRSFVPGASLTLGGTTYTAVGWESFEGVDMFRIEAAYAPSPYVLNNNATLRYDGVHALPAVVHYPVSISGAGTLRLVGAVAGDGDVLATGAYVAPEAATARPGVVRVPFTVDGPAEPFSDIAPLSKVIAVAKLDPRVALWHLAHPDAYVRLAQFGDLGGAGVHWWIDWLDPHTRGIFRIFGAAQGDPSTGAVALAIYQAEERRRTS